VETGRGANATLVATVAAAGIVQLPTAAIVLALPTIHGQFDTSMAELQWTVTAFYIPFAAFLIAAGRLADVFGRRRLLLIGTAIFALGSALALVSPNVQLLIAGIAVSGIGGAVLMPSSMSLITNVFTGERRGLAIGMWGAATELVSGIGVLVGGVLTGELSWRWIFGVDILFALMIAVLAWRWTPESRDPTASRRIDLTGAALSVTALTALTLGLIQGPLWGWGSAPIVLLLVAAVALFAAFVVAERRAREPVFNLDFFRHRNFAGATTSIFVIDFSFGALLFFLPLYFQEIADYSPLETGVLLLPLTGLMVVASPLGGKIAARTGPQPPIVVGLALMAIAIFWIAGNLGVSTSYSELWLPTAILGFGIGLALTPMNLAAMNAVSRDHAGSAAGMLVTLSGLGATLGVAVTGALFDELQTQRTVQKLGEVGVHSTRHQAQELASKVLGSSGGETSLSALSKGHAQGVEGAVRSAFVSALSTSLEVSAFLVLVGVVLALVLLRRSEPADAAASDHPVGSATPRPAPLGASSAP
jgi:EmrB/QacA subfamily drug resistance transporter